MLYVFSGSDQVVVRERAHALVLKLEEKGALVRRLEPEQYQHGIVRALSGSTSLFGESEAVVLDSLSGIEGALEEIADSAELLSGSQNHFIVIEKKIPTEFTKALKKHAEEYFESKDSARDFFNVFSLADALSRRDKKMLWVLLMRARMAGLSPEEISGTLFWQLKSLRLAKITRNAKEAGLKDFAYNKSKNALKNFKKNELEKLSRDLVTLYHEGHLGKDMDIALEKWVLKI